MNATLSNRQNEILEASISVINSEGIQGFTIKNLSNAIGFTEAAIYRHFKSKNEILCAILEGFIFKLQKFTSEIKQEETNSLHKIELIYKQLSTIFTNKPAYVSVIFAEEIFKNNKALSKKVSNILKINNDTFNSIIEQGQKNNEITKKIESQELTLITMGAFRLMVKNWKMCDFSFNLKESSTRLFSSIEILIQI